MTRFQRGAEGWMPALIERFLMRWAWRRTAEQPRRPSNEALNPDGAVSRAAPSDAELVRQLAVQHLPEPHVEIWLSLLRPAVQLVPSSDGTGHVARLGGLPLLPDDVDWPEWPDHGPLSYIGEVRCDRLAEFSLDIDVPVRGRLLFFYFDGSFDNCASTVGTWDASTLQGARALHISEETACSPRSAPVGIRVYPARDFAGREIVTGPGWEHPDLEAAFRMPGEDRRSFMDHPVNADAFADALHERHVVPMHQIGGYADPVQGPVEFEVAQAAVTSALPYDDPRLSEEARRWELLFQVDTDDELGMEWGDGGVLYWMIRTDEGRDDSTKLSEVSFTWQCG